MVTARLRVIEQPKAHNPMVWFDEVQLLALGQHARDAVAYRLAQQARARAIHEYQSMIDSALFDALSPTHIQTAVRSTMAKPINPTLEEFWQEEPVIGWRAWKLGAHIEVNAVSQAVGIDQVRLQSHAYQHFAWEPGQPMIASCEAMAGYHGEFKPPPARHPAPHEWCSCGVHSFRHLEDLIPELHFSGDGLVIGRVAHWGRTIQCRKGWRSQYGYPLSLEVMEVPDRVMYYPAIVGRHQMDARMYIADCLQKAYGVPAMAGTYPLVRRADPRAPLVSWGTPPGQWGR